MFNYTFAILTLSVVAVLLHYSNCQEFDTAIDQADDFSEINEVEEIASDASYDGSHVKLSLELFDLMMGRTGRQGSGVTYTRWGRTSCPKTSGTTMLYSGKVAGSHYTHSGGGANYLCVPDKVEYLASAGNHKGSFSVIYGTEYEGTLVGTQNYNVPCSVCYVQNRGAKLMIPASASCPSSWTVEYKGFLMAERYNHKRNAVYECVDENAENIANSAANNDGALFYHVISDCHVGVPCPPFQKNRVITCTVCTK